MQILIAGLESGIAGDIKSSLQSNHQVEMSQWTPSSSNLSQPKRSEVLIYCTGSRNQDIARAFELNVEGFSGLLAAVQPKIALYLSSRVVVADEAALSLDRKIYRATKRLGELTLIQWVETDPTRIGIVLRPPVVGTSHVDHALQQGDAFYMARVAAQGGVVTLPEITKIVETQVEQRPQGSCIVELRGPKQLYVMPLA